MANYATMRKDELIALAQEKGLEADASMTKAQIIAAIESAENVTAEPESAVENVIQPAEDSAMELLKAQNELLRQQMEELQKQLLALQRPQVIQVAADTERV